MKNHLTEVTAVCACLIHIVLLLAFDDIAIEHLLTYGWIFRGVVFTAITFNVWLAYEAARAIVTGK